MLAGSMVALVTPMDADGSVNYADLGRLIDFHVAAGTEALIIAGTTGESATLDHDEHLELLTVACQLAQRRIPIIAGTGSNSTAQTLRLSQEADQLAVDAFLLVTPYYNKPTQEGMYQHFRTIADAVHRPIILYNVPARTGVDLKPETVIRLASHPNIRSIKEATGDLARVDVLKEGCGPDFCLLSGDDATACAFMLRGGHGVISVTANIAPKAMRALCDAARAGRRAEAERIDATLQPLHQKLFLESNPIPVKWAVAQMGLIGPGIRLPLTALAARYHRDVLAAMHAGGVEPKRRA
ncbi:MAG TPA: 4-hydroxy-tetrahydrodipicolinate synthase [Gammaproteobacteria bacterium]